MNYKKHNHLGFIVLLSLYAFICIHTQLTSQEEKFPNFNDYVQKFNKIYENAQYQQRQKIYLTNIQKIKGLKCDACGVNMFTDYSEQDMKKKKGSFQSDVPFPNNQPFNLKSAGMTLVDKTPLSYDWRDYKAVTSVKDQRNCGACWAFSTTAFFQSDLIINSNASVSIDLSQQFLTKCDNRSLGCDGGFLFWAMDRVIDDGGMPTQKQYPYTYSIPQPQGMCYESDLVKVDHSRKLVSYYEVQDQKFIQKLILKKPININMCSPDFQFYAPNTNSRTLTCSASNTNRDHTILLIGYTQTQWIVKNQWGPTWGVNGFAYVSRNADNDCCIGKQLFTTALVSQKCQITNCETCVEQTSCHKCNNGYYISNQNQTQSCQKCILSNCAKCVNFFGLCDTCVDGYSVTYPSYRCAKWTVDHCSFMYNGHCSQCHTGYVLNNKSQCVDINTQCYVDNCDKCVVGDFQSCQVCSSEYLLNATTKKCSPKPLCKVENCLLCSANDSSVCQTCKQNFQFSPILKKCRSICKVDNCQQCSAQNASICESCLNGFSSSTDKSKCYKCQLAYCSSCSKGASSCQNCLQGFYLYPTSLTCLKCSSVSNCLECSFSASNLTCTKCSDGYTPTLDGLKCLKCLDGCINCNSTSLNVCSSSCNIGRYFDNTTSTCSNCQLGCLECSSPQSCIKCQDSYIFDKGACIQLCQQNSKCINCNSKDTSVCQVCVEGYKVNNGKCVLDSTYKCLQQNNLNSDSCSSCPDRYYLNTINSKNICSKCLVTDQNCVTCSSTSPTLCLDCQQGYFIQMSNSSCIKCSAFNINCIKCQNKNYCTQCQSGFYLLSTFNSSDQNSGVCSSCNPSCMTCKHNQNFCTSCYQGYQIANSHQCLTKTKIVFVIRLDAAFQKDLNNVLLIFYDQMMKVLKYGQKRYIQVSKVSQGSIILEGNLHMSQDQQNQTQFLASTKTTLTGLQMLGTYKVLSTSVQLVKSTTVQDSTTNTTNTTNQNMNKNLRMQQSSNGVSNQLILGVSIGGGIFAVLVVLVLIFMIRKYLCKKSDKQNQEAEIYLQKNQKKVVAPQNKAKQNTKKQKTRKDSLQVPIYPSAQKSLNKQKQVSI